MGQKYGFLSYDVRSGLTHSQVRSLLQDKTGYIWVGTLGGLSRFDGREFVQFTSDQGLPFDQVNCLAQMSDGTIAAGSIGRIAFLRPAGNIVISLPPGLERSAVNHIAQDASGKVWISSHAGLFVLPHFPALSGEPLLSSGGSTGSPEIQGPVQKALPGKESVLVLTENALISLAPGRTDTLLDARFAPYSDVVESGGLLWVASIGYGLLCRKEQGWEVLEPAQGLVSNRILSLCADGNGGVWASSRNGVSHVDARGDMLSLTATSGLPNAEVRCLLRDREGILWMGTDGGGMARFLGESFASYSQSEGLPSNLVMSISPDTVGRLWIATFDQGIYRMGPEPEHIDWSKGLANDKVWDILCDSQGRIWAATSGGISLLENGRIRNFDTASGLKSDKILCVYEDGEGRLWAGTSSGLNSIDPLTLEISGREDLGGAKVRDILEDAAGALWFATSRGVFRMKDADSGWFEIEGEDNEQSCSSLALDKRGRLWVGAKNGAYVLEGSEFKRVKLSEAYSGNFVNFLQQVDEGMIAGTNNGLYLIVPDENGAFRIRHFGMEDGLGSLETNLNAVHYDEQGRLWFGTTAGLTRHIGSFADMEAQAVPPGIAFSDIRLNLSPTVWKAGEALLDPVSGLPLSARVKHFQNHFTFYFQGLSHAYPGALKYRYRLEGFDEDWQPLSDAGFATYANLHDGEYVFKVQAVDKFGNYSGIAGFPLRVLPPYWKTWWFIMLSTVLAIGIVAAVVNRRKKRLLERLENEKTELKSRLLALEHQSLNSSMNRHFIFNALNSIQYYINRQDKASANKYLSSFARLIRKNLDSSQLNHTSLEEEIDRLELYLQLEHMRFQDRFEYDIRVDAALDSGNIRVPAMLLQPFLENSIWHGILPKGEKGKVSLSIQAGKDEVEFEICDDGIGIDTSLRSKGEAGSHISQGMSITRGRLELISKMSGRRAVLEGPEELKDGEGKVTGTRVRIIIPNNWEQNSIRSLEN